MARKTRDKKKAEEAPEEIPQDAELESSEQSGELDEHDLLLQVEEYKSRWQRAQADYQNAKRRGLAEQEAAVRRALQPLLDDCLLVLDHLEMALMCPANGDEARMLAQGVELTKAQFVSILERNGVTPIPEGGMFDPAQHQAMESVEDSGAEPGTIVATLRRGFRWGDSVLRYAQVKVAAGEAEEVTEEGDASSEAPGE